MRAVPVRAVVGDDGLLRLEVPVPYKNAELDMILVINAAEDVEPTSESLGWPSDFFERFAGVFANTPILRGDTVVTPESEVVG